jgi:PEGA domain
MSARRVAVLAGVALVLVSPAAGAAPKRVGFAVLVEADADAAPRSARAVDAVRAGLAGRGLAPVPAGALRAALEEPMAPGDPAAAALAGARERLDSARQAYTEFEYDRALAELDAIDRLLLDREPAPPLVALLVERHLLAGLVHEGRRRPADARRSFRMVHHLDPERRSLDPGEYRPQTVALYEKAVTSDDRASVRVVTQPAGARIWLDGRALGETPLDLERMSAGAHWVVAVAPGHRPRGATVDLDPDARASTPLSLALEKRPAAERAAEQRRALMAAGDGERRSAAAQLARTAGVDLLVLVRARGGRIEAVVFDARRGSLSAWLAMPSDRLSRALAPAGEVGGGSPALFSGTPTAPERSSSPSWYGTWWGRTILIAGGLALGGAVFYAVSADGDQSYSVGDWCFAGRDC